MDKRFITFILLSIVIIYGWQFLSPSKKTVPQQPVKSEQIEPKSDEIVNNKINLSQNDKISLKNDVKNKEIITNLSNDFITIETTSQGAKINHIYIDSLNDKKQEESETRIDLVNSDQKNNYLSFDAFINKQAFDFNTQPWIVDKKEKELVFTVSPAEGLKIYKKIILEEKNLGKIILGVENKTGQTINLTNMKLLWGPGKREGKDQFNVKKVVALEGRKVKRFKPKKKESAETVVIKDGFIGMADQYFCSIFHENKGNMNEAIVYQHANQSLDITMKLQDLTVASNENKEIELNYFFGSQHYDELKQLGIKAHKLVDFGWFPFLSVPMYHALKYFFTITKNYGLAIILLTILIRAILWYPTHRSQTSMKKMQTAMAKMQPRLKTLKEVYKDNPQKLNEETMKLYKEYQINPMGGCLPMLLMMPVLFAMFSIMRSAVELKGAPFFWMWQDLSLKDPTYILPIAMGLSMFLQQKISTPPAATPEAATQQKMMLYLMPIMLTFFSFMWPSGLLLYWVISNILSIGQQLIINMKKA